MTQVPSTLGTMVLHYGIAVYSGHVGFSVSINSTFGQSPDDVGYCSGLPRALCPQQL